MDTFKIYQDDQENRPNTGIPDSCRSKDNHIIMNMQTRALQQNKRTVLGVLQSNCARNVTKQEIHKDEKNVKPKLFIPVQHEPHKNFKNKTESNFPIYEDNLEVLETNIQHRDFKEKKETEINCIKKLGRSDRKCAQLDADINTSVTSHCVSFFNDYKEHDEEKQDDDYSEDSSMLNLSVKKPDSYNNSFQDEYMNKNKLYKAKYEEQIVQTEYRIDVYKYLRSTEICHRPKPGYMKKQPDITYSMRSILIDWLVEVAQEYELHDETLYLAVSYIDRFLSYMSVVRSKLQLVGAAALFIAAKYEEVFPPDITAFVYITDDTYTKTQVIRMENLILRVLAFDLTVPTPLSFLLQFGIANDLSNKIMWLAMYFCELSLLEADPYLQYLPSHLAASAIALAQHTYGEKIWSERLEMSTEYSLKDLEECISYLYKTFCNAPSIRQQAIQDKYRNSKYGNVSLLLPCNTEPVSYEDEEVST